MQREHRRTSRVGGRALALSGALALAFVGSGTAFAAPTNPILAKEWALGVLQNAEIHSKFNDRGAGVIVAVVDTGVDPNQPDLQDSLVSGVNLVNPDDPTSDFADQDTVDSHGTSIATIIAGHTHTDSSNNTTGMVGLADQAKIMPVKISAGSSGGTNASLDAGIKYATDHGANVISISTGPDGACPTDVTQAIDYALSHGVVVVAATGNTAESGNEVGCPAPVSGVIDVSAIDSSGQMDPYSHYGSDVDVAAPGVGIEVGLINGQYGEKSGSSLAAPWVSAEAALLISIHPTWTSGQIVAAIVDNTTQDANGQSKAGQRIDDHVGYGVIDPVAALGASEPTQTTNPLGGPPITSTPAANVSASASAQSTNGTSPTAAAKSSSKGPLIIGIAAAVIVLLGLLIFLLTRGRNNRGGKGGPGGGGGGNGYNAPQTPPGGQYAQPPQYQQQPNPYQQPPQQQYPPQQGGYGSQQPQNPYQGR